MIKKISFAILFFILTANTFAQLGQNKISFSHSDSLRGTLTDLRTCYDVVYYDLNVDVNISDESINGFNKIYFRAQSDFDKMQVDLFKNMSVDRISFEKSESLKYTRDEGAVFISLPRTIKKGETSSITFNYSGKPITGKILPWDGGFDWRKDDDGNPWVVVACQGTGASLWWPCKEHQSDEPDSMSIRITVPDNVMDVSNGRLREVKKVGSDKMQYHWFVSYPINNYNVTINIGAFEHFSDIHINGKDTLTLDYYVKKYNLEKAKEQFAQVKPMLNCFEKYFGNYPFYRDGYKLIETPYLGMEHQGAIAYGNRYRPGYLGKDYYNAGTKWDYIIIHESAHEWWGNNVTTKDIADMWVHEGFGSYAEVLYTKCSMGDEAALRYCTAQKTKVGNRIPVIGSYNVNSEGSDDMYPKGSLMLNTIHHIIGNDSLWFSIIKGLQKTFALQTVTSRDVENYILKQSGKNLAPVFDQYLRYTKIPVFEYEIQSENPVVIKYRWQTDVTNFEMPAIIKTSNDIIKTIYPTNQWQTLSVDIKKAEEFMIDDVNFYIKVEKINSK